MPEDDLHVYQKSAESPPCGQRVRKSESERASDTHTHIHTHRERERERERESTVSIQTGLTLVEYSSFSILYGAQRLASATFGDSAPPLRSGASQAHTDTDTDTDTDTH